MNMTRRQKALMLIGLVITLVVVAGVFLWMKQQKLIVKQTGSSEGVLLQQQEPAAPNSQLPSGDALSFDNLPDTQVIKNHTDDVYTYDFAYKRKVFGHIELNGNWFVEHFLSYDNGDNYFGFSLDGSGTAGKEYWGPSILYRSNEGQGSLVKVVDFSQDAAIANGKEVVPNSWNADYFITDLSDDENSLVYCNFWTDTNRVFLKDISTGQVKEFPVGADLADFGDATLSPDKKTIAFAGVKRAATDDGSTGKFIEADIYMIDVTSGTVDVYQTNKQAGSYELNGWNGAELDYGYANGE